MDRIRTAVVGTVLVGIAMIAGAGVASAAEPGAVSGLLGGVGATVDTLLGRLLGLLGL